MSFATHRRLSLLVLAIGFGGACRPRAASKVTAVEGEDGPGAFQSSAAEENGRRLTITSDNGTRLRLTAYGASMVRFQYARKGEDFLPDDHYEMVAKHDFDGRLEVEDGGDELKVRLTGEGGGWELEIAKNDLRYDAFSADGHRLMVKEKGGIGWAGNRIKVDLTPDPGEHFTGMGHGFHGSQDTVDLRGKTISRGYGKTNQDQAPLVVPFFLSSKGYGVFLNSTFEHTFHFNAGGAFDFGIDDGGFGGRMDYFLILGPDVPSLMDRYTQLTGRPRLPQLAVFGLTLTDKAHANLSDARFFERKTQEHRQKGWPLDHLVSDNRWRAAGGGRCDSKFEWDPGRYPDPRVFAQFLARSGLIFTVDFNRCIAKRSEGYQGAFNIQNLNQAIEFSDSAPDFTRDEVRSWWWKLMLSKTFDPGLDFPGDSIWIDEFDQMGGIPAGLKLGNGLRWAEMRNYWFFLIAKALVQEGWDKDIGDRKRPYVWVRGMTAGAQRYASLWSGDIVVSYDVMKQQIRAMQTAGLSGFAFWGHDAGGFRPSLPRNRDPLYNNWSMEFGSFAPIWKPHGTGDPGRENDSSRWPADRGQASQKEATRYTTLRYSLMPYTYGLAHAAHASGLPMARSMLVHYTAIDKAWSKDLQYLWGRDILVAPMTQDPRGDGPTNVPVWLPPRDDWYDFFSEELLQGDRDLAYPVRGHRLPLFVRAGAVLPMVKPVKTSLRDIDWSELHVHAYLGGTGEFTMVEDDGVSELFESGQKRETKFDFDSREGAEGFTLRINGGEGGFTGAVPARRYRVHLHGVNKSHCVRVNGQNPRFFPTEESVPADQDGVVFLPGVQHPTETVVLKQRLANADLTLTDGGPCEAPGFERFEAEGGPGVRSNGVAVGRKDASGGHCAARLGEAQSFLEATVQRQRAGKFLFTVGYINGSAADANVALKINGTAAGNLLLSGTNDGELVTLVTREVTLRAGANTIRLEGGGNKQLELDFVGVSR